jgi:hypothetical protein
MLKRVTLKFLALCLGASVTAGLVWADGGAGEISGSGGVFRVNGHDNPSLGGTIGANLGRFVNLFGEVSYMPLGSVSQQSGTTRVTVSDKLMNYGGGFQVRIPIPRLEPYGMVTFGYGRYTEEMTITVLSNTTTSSRSLGSGYAGAGAGARVFVGKRWGFKPEFRYQHYFGNNPGSTASLVLAQFDLFTVTGGIFFQF